ncbi:hypothetical protein TWF718_002477 [Orbilia javanica]|uniref:Uncharacterized protein n=1 Tax=Orbilia javanica TaxID=47235 RepID=A0AAN8MG17_9PEZI
MSSPAYSPAPYKLVYIRRARVNLKDFNVEFSVFNFSQGPPTQESPESLISTGISMGSVLWELLRTEINRINDDWGVGDAGFKYDIQTLTREVYDSDTVCAFLKLRKVEAVAGSSSEGGTDLTNGTSSGGPW